MKLCFSTIGCPNWSLKDIVTIGQDLGYKGIEIRSINNNVYAPEMKEFTIDIDKTVQILSKANIEIAMLTTNCALANHNDITCVERAKRYVDLAEKLKVKYIRLMSTDKPYFDGGDINLCKSRYKEIVNYAKNKNVIPLMETNGLFVDTKLLASFLDEIGDGCGALWDTHHPYRFNDESIETTINNLGRHIKYVHLKDSIIEKGQVTYKMMGHGDMPLNKIINLLIANGYDGYYTLEWVKMWNKDLEDAGIVFAHYANYMNRNYN